MALPEAAPENGARHYSTPGSHEDHIGSTTTFLGFNVPIYGTKFTLALVSKRLDERGLLDTAKLNEVAASENN